MTVSQYRDSEIVSAESSILKPRGATAGTAVDMSNKRRRMYRDIDKQDKSNNMDNRMATLTTKRDRAHAELRVWGQQDRPVLNGVERLYKFQEMVLSAFIYRPHIFQKRFFAKILQSMAMLIVGEREWAQYGPSLMRKFGWKTTPRKCFGLAPRRFGKTIMLGMVQSALALIMPTTQATFATGKRASEVLKEAVVKCLVDSNYRDQITSKGTTGETIRILPLFGGDDRSEATVSFYPSNPKIRILAALFYIWCCFNLVHTYTHTHIQHAHIVISVVCMGITICAHVAMMG
ncbi:hypothetical protein KDA14_01750 [Candidatus Saccharibacteria bacterium]|nr:hypothetical protein [Candidatus Saccharibacteria bacterium]